MYHVNVLEKLIQENRRKTVSTFIEKRDKSVLEKFCYTLDGEIFCLTVLCFFKKFRKVQIIFSRKSRKISLHSKRISMRRSGSFCNDERRESIQRKENFYKSHQIVLLSESYFLVGSLVSRWYRSKYYDNTA